MLRNLGIIKGALLTDRQCKNLNRHLAGKTVLEWVVRMMTDCEHVDGVVVLADNGKKGELVRSITPVDVPVFSSDGEDTMDCLVDVLETYSAESFLFIGPDWPFVDPTLVDQLIRAAWDEKDCDYAAYQFMNEIFSAGRPYGLFPEWYRTSTLFRANRVIEGNVYRNLPGCYFLDNQKKYTIELLPAPVELDRDDVRLTCLRQDDWDHILTLYDALGVDACEWQKLSSLLSNQPQMRQSMARLNHAELAEV